MKGFSMLLLLLGLSRTNSQAQETSCHEVKDSLCITSESFTKWDDARDHCIDLGGDLVVPRRNSSDIQELVKTSVWVGGRVTSVWIKDNSWYYYGEWKGCVVNTDILVTFQPSDDLSGCLQSCSRFKFAYVKTSMCGCFNAKYTELATDSDSCPDPYVWNASLQDIPPTRVHLFTMTTGITRRPRQRQCGQIELRSGNRLRRAIRRCEELKLPLCQFANISSTRDHVNYGQSYLLTADNNETWDSGRQNCSTDGGSLAKLDWESPMFTEKLREAFGDFPMWVGLGPLGWYFIDGSPVTPTLPDLKDGECLVQGPTGLGSVTCEGDLNFRAACTLTTRSAEDQPVDDSYSDVSVGVGVSVGIVAAVTVGVAVAWWIRKKKSTAGDRSGHGNRNQQVTSGVESISIPEQNVAETSTQMNTYAKLYQASVTTRAPDYESINDINASKDTPTNGKITKQDLSDKQNVGDTPNPKQGQEDASILSCPPKNQHQLDILEATSTMDMNNQAISMDPTDSHDGQESASVSHLVLPSDEEAAGNSDQPTPVSTQFPKNQDQLNIPKATVDMNNEATGMGPTEDTSDFYFVLTHDEQTVDNSDQPTPVDNQFPKNQDQLDIPRATMGVDNEAIGMGPPEDTSAFYLVLTHDEQAADNSDQPTPVNTQFPKSQDHPGYSESHHGCGQRGD